MTLWTVLLVMVLTLVGLIALAAIVISRAPGWRELRPFIWVAVAAVFYCAGDTALAIGLPDQVAVLVGRAQMLAAGFHLAAWHPFNAAMEKRRLTRLEWALGTLLICAGALFQVPELAIRSEARHHWVPLLNAAITDEVPTPFGQLLYVVLLFGVAWQVGHFVRLARRGVDYAPAMVLALFLFLLTGFNDALASSGVAPLPYLSGAGLMFMVIGVGYNLARRFLSYASSLQVLSAQLERTVEQRGKELAEANQALTRAEKLAAVGQLAAGVAHEINNPAAVIKGNLTFLKQELSGTLDREVAECLDDSLTAVGRIARIVRELLSAGRVAGRAEARLEVFNLGDSVESALTLAAPALTGPAKVTDRGGRELAAIGQCDLVAQVVANLVTNAAQAIASSGVGANVLISCERRGESAVLTVDDDGPGIPEPLQARVFEPFFTTKEVGQGTGLGLAVSLGLMQAQGGGLTLRHSRRGATRFELTLPYAPPAARAAPSEPAPVARRKLKLLLVDDDVAVLGALHRTLKSRHQVTIASGVKQALALIDAGAAFDALLCDVAMPDGGGEGLHATLKQRHPQLAGRTFFITGGALEPRSREFIEQHRDRVLLKPFDIQQLYRLLEALEPPAPIPLPAAAESEITARAG